MSMYVPLGFEVLEEPWNEYMLSDGTKLRQKLVLTYVAKIAGAYDQLGRPIYQPAFNLAFSVVAPKELRGQPSIPPPDMREVAETASEVVEISRVVRDEPSRYRFEDGTEASFKIVITTIKRSPKYDQFGMPIYMVDWSLAPSYEIPKMLWRSRNASAAPGPT